MTRLYLDQKFDGLNNILERFFFILLLWRYDIYISVVEPEVYDDIDDSDANNPYVRYEYEDRVPCQKNNDNSKLNPIYIAVPIAGVCVLLALIIFAMYLLRRRSDFYAQYDAYHYHEQMAKLANKQNETKVQGCDTNRCTDSERSSQGSESKLFLTAWCLLYC